MTIDRFGSLPTLSCAVLVFVCLLAVPRSGPAAEAGIRELKPELGYVPDVSRKAQDELERGKALLKEVYAQKTSPEALSPADQELMAMAEEKGNVWHVGEMGCSWYCGGGESEVVASSVLPPTAKISYEAKNAHDFDLQTAWVEGAEGYGIGESIEYRFPPRSPRVNQVQVFNGYHKSESAWKDNARVKRLRLYVNGRPYGDLLLEDSRAFQIFHLDPLWERDNVQPVTLRFEIRDVYPGARWKDVAISEIEFDGLDVHCFVAGTLVRMADGTSRPIEALKVGDEVASMNLDRSALEAAVVEETVHEIHAHLVKLDLEGTPIVSTDDHPYWVPKKGWCSVNPRASAKYLGMEHVGLLQVGDEIVSLGRDGELGTRKVVSIARKSGVQDTFSITKLSRNSSFFANGALVGVEARRHGGSHDDQ